MSSLIDPTIRPDPGANRRPFLPGRLVWTSVFDFATLVIDTTEFDFHLDVTEDCPPAVVREVLGHARDLGFDPLDEDECEPELLDCGSTRIYLVPTVPVDDAPLIAAGEELPVVSPRRPPVPRAKGGYYNLGVLAFAVTALAPKAGLLGVLAGGS